MTRRSNCPISCVLDLIGDKWTLLILRDMMFFNKRQFFEFLESPEKISTNILTDRLHKLEQAGVIAKQPYSSHRYRFEYHVTETGQELKPILNELGKWGLKHCENTKTRSMQERDDARAMAERESEQVSD
jgi:DNA-binding HxlR family transcriptional regulator